MITRRQLRGIIVGETVVNYLGQMGLEKNYRRPVGSIRAAVCDVALTLSFFAS